MALIPCVECGRQVSDRAAMCPGCAHPVYSDTRDEPKDQEPLRDRLISPLIECNSCHRPLAKSADDCPGCGAKNEWRHPVISGFLAADYHGPKFDYEFSSTALWGYVEKPSIGFWLMGASAPAAVAAIVLFFVSFQLGFFFMSLAILSQLVSLTLTYFSDDAGKEFRVEFEDEGFNWTSNDETFWRPVRSMVDHLWKEYQN